MKKVFIISIIAFLSLIPKIKAQDKISENVIEKLKKQINGILPEGWIVKTLKDNPNEIVIQTSDPIELTSPMTANDPLEVKEPCEIYILVVDKVSPDSINLVRALNEKLKQNLPPQESKDNLKKWYKENEKTLKTLDSEPTHYGDKFSYRIKCRKLPKDKKDIEDYEKIMENINSLFRKYEE
jgi:hypothetical protein